MIMKRIAFLALTKTHTWTGFPIALVAGAFAVQVGCDAASPEDLDTRDALLESDEKLDEAEEDGGVGEVLAAPGAGEPPQDGDADTELGDTVLVEHPVAEIILPNGGVLNFYASEFDGGTGVIEYGDEGAGSVLETFPDDVTALEVFLAFSEAGSEVPPGLLPSEDSGQQAQTELGFAAKPQGWALDAYFPLDGEGDPLAAASWCNSSGAFVNRFCTTGSTYTTWYCVTNTSTYKNSVKKVVNWSGGQCALSGSVFSSNMKYRSLSSSCGSPGSWVSVWAYQMYPGGWFSYTWNGAKREWQHGRSSGGVGHFGNKWKYC